LIAIVAGTINSKKNPRNANGIAPRNHRKPMYGISNGPKKNANAKKMMASISNVRNGKGDPL